MSSEDLEADNVPQVEDVDAESERTGQEKPISGQSIPPRAYQLGIGQLHAVNEAEWYMPEGPK